MSKLESIAGNLRTLANDASPLSANVRSSARRLDSLGKEAESLSRNGVDLNRLLSAIQSAQKAAESAASAAAQVKSDGVAWADHLARGGGGTGKATRSTNALATPPAAYADFAKKITLALVSKESVGTWLPVALGQVADKYLPGAGEPIERNLALAFEAGLIEWTHVQIAKVVNELKKVAEDERDQ